MARLIVDFDPEVLHVAVLGAGKGAFCTFSSLPLAPMIEASGINSRRPTRKYKGAVGRSSDRLLTDR